MGFTGGGRGDSMGREVRFDPKVGTPGYLYRVGSWVVANANLVDAETGEGLPGKYVLITIQKDSTVLLHEYDYSRSPDGWVIKQVQSSGDMGYSAVFYFPGDATYNSKTFVFAPTISADLAAFAASEGIPLEDIPIGTNDMLVMVFESAPEGDWTEIAGAVREKVWAEYPDVLVINIKQYGKKIVVFVHGSPLLFAVVVVALAICLVAMWTIVIPKILEIKTLETYAKLKQQNSDRISEILADPSLTPEQKQALIEEILGEEVKELPQGGGIVEILKWATILVGAGAGTYLVIAAVSSLKKGR
jgi:hypothetical protein